MKEKNEEKFSYLVTYQVGAKIQKFIVTNHVKVPSLVLTTMAEDKIESEILDMSLRQPPRIDINKFKSKLRKSSTIETEDLSDIKKYKLSLNFNKDEQVKNEYREPAEA